MNIKLSNNSTRSGRLAWLAQTRSTLALCAMIGAVLATAGLLATTSARAGDSDCRDSAVFPPHSHPYGASYAEWLARDWQWLFSLPTTANPGLGTADFSANQHGEVWFLPGVFAGGTVTLTGTIPEGTALFGPVFSAEWDNVGCPYTDYTVHQLEGIVQGVWSAVTETSCTIDGVAVRGMDNPQATPYLVRTPPFSYTVASHDNIWANLFGCTCIPDGTTVYPAVACGVCVMIAPLPVGHHTIQFHVVYAGSVWQVPGVWDMTYEITVVPPGHHGHK